MKQKEKQSFIFRYKWFNRFERLSATQIVLLLKAMNAYSKQQDISIYTKKMQEKTIIVWELIAEDLLEDMQAYESKCEKLRENASRGGLARVANASKCTQMTTFASKCTQIEPYSDSDKDKKEKIYKKEKSKCLTFEQICELARTKINNNIVADCFISFLTMRDSLPNNKSVSNEVTLDTLIRRLHELAHNEDEAINILNNSIRNNLTDLYPLKKDTIKESVDIKYAN